MNLHSYHEDIAYKLLQEAGTLLSADYMVS